MDRFGTRTALKDANLSNDSAQQQQAEEQWDCLCTNDARWGKNDQGQQTVNEIYVLLREIGRGSYGRVYLCERRVGDGVETPWRRFAMKVMSKPRLRRLSEYVNVPAGGMRKVTAEEKVREQVYCCAAFAISGSNARHRGAGSLGVSGSYVRFL